MAYGIEIYDTSGNKLLDSDSRLIRVLFSQNVASSTNYTYNIPTAYQTKEIIYYATPYINSFGSDWTAGWGHYAYKSGNSVYFECDYYGSSVNEFSLCFVGVIT